MFVRLLGPVELRTADGRSVEPAAAKRRATLALLALELGRTVPVGRFFELLWGDAPPARARAALQGHIAALRKLIAGSGLVLSTRPPGYRLDGPADAVDSLLFERLVADAAARSTPDGDEAAAGLLRRALSLWQGSAALADLPETDLRDALADRLRKDRTLALEAWADRLLRLGLGADAVPELDRAAEADPWNEALAARLVLCLQQSGRSWDALNTYHRTRRRLAADLGVGPGSALRSAVSGVLSEDGARRPAVGTAPAPVRLLGRPRPGTAPATAAPAATATAARAASTAATVRPATATATTPFASCKAAPRPADRGRPPVARPTPVSTSAGTPTTAKTAAPAPAPPARTPVAPPAPTRAQPVAAPDQLPRPASGFVGRIPELDWLSDRLRGSRAVGPDTVGPDAVDAPGIGTLAVLVGPAGTGKTATALRWAHDAAAGYPDGRLFADVNAFGPGRPAGPAAVLGRFLRALGVPESELPEDRPARAALYRSLSRNRRLLVVLDDVADAGDVTDLLPAGPGCATVITSRSTLADLVVTEGAALLRLGPLPAEDAGRLLEQLLGRPRVAAEPEAAARLAELCGGLPLALRIVAARLATRPAWAIADLLPELDDERTRLHALDTRGSNSLRAALDRTLRHLSGTAAHLLALLAVHPGRETDVPAAAALLGAGPDEARDALAALAAHHLLTEIAPGRYRRCDLVRLYGAELLDERHASEHATATAALADHYLATVAHGAALLQPAPGATAPTGPVGPPSRPGGRRAARPHLPTVRSILDWFQAEEPAVRGLVAAASESGDHDRAWRLAYRADGLYYSVGRRPDRLACLRTGLDAAGRTGDPAAVAAMEAVTARALSGRGRTVEAHRLARRAVDRSSGTDDAVRVQALTVLAVTTAAGGRPAEAVRLGERAIALAETHGHAEHAPYALSNTAGLYGLAGDPAQALRRAREARALLVEHPLAVFHLSAMINEAHALQLLGRHADAEEAWRQTVERCRFAGAVHLHAVAERHFADFLLATGRTPEAVGTLRAARGLYGRLGDTTVVGELDRRLAVLAG
ncbi:DNA-binding transcriptional activator of the SARP family [Streptomyces sp. TLI_053]|uniref:AfsR/SARP family transcriptional regulator n=1 Tax=Streptomyces sp. TLI_053 TaxID=1855352 RepID=UPI0008793D45|nr:BTAD domain-containing putative transcriptional regulator [Streptomyces sp. TLI_053]SDT81476.1 DNA-binding transcriptional activator of the SARP family [Streptomyces sp. TLI_053]